MLVERLLNFVGQSTENSRIMLLYVLPYLLETWSWCIGQLFVDSASEESAGPGKEGVDALTNSRNVWEFLLLAGTGKFTSFKNFDY